jgi:predicted PurR-regulated permease PerM
MFFISYIISATFRPAVNFLEKKRIPRMISTIVIFILSFALISLLLVTIAAEGYNQLNNLFSQLPTIVYNILTNINNTIPINSFIDPQAIKDNLKDIVSVLMKLDLSIFTNGISSAVGILSAAATLTVALSMISVLSIYMLLRKDDMAANLLIFFNKEHKHHYLEVFKKIELKLGSWLRAQVLVMCSAGFFVWLGLSLPALFIPNYDLHNYALPIALLVVIIEIVPGFGIATGGILTTVIALATGNVFLIIFAPLLFIIIQQLESMLIVPKLMSKAIDLDPVITILGIVAGSLLFGIVGVILIIPLLAVAKILLTEFLDHEDSK